MNNIFKISLMVAAGAALLSCSRTIDAPVPGKRPQIPEEPAIVDAQFNLTRFAVSGANVNWVDGLTASVYDGVQEGPVSFDISGSKALTAVISGRVSNQSDLFYIVYPESQTVSFNEGVAVVEVPENQLAGPAGEAISMPATAMTALPKANMRNAAAAVVVNVAYDNIKSIALTALSGEAISGKEEISIYENEISVSEAGASTITLTPQSGECFAPGTVTFATLPGVVSGGFKVETTGADGSVATSWFYEEYSLAIGKSSVLGDVKKPLADKESFQAVLTGSTSSTLTFSWSPSGGADPAADAASPYTFGLYRDAACTDLVVQFSTEAGAAAWMNNTPAFIFTGLEQGKSYWFKAYKDDYAADAEAIETSNVVEAKTAVFDIVNAPSGCKAGDIILAEDFSELLWGGDGVGKAAGHINYPGYKDGMYLQSNPGPALGEGKNTARVTFYPYYNEARLFREMAAAVAGTRIDSWGQINEGSAALVCIRPGYVKLGASSYVGFIVSPGLDVLQEGKYYDLKVSFKAARYESDPCNALVQVVRGENGDGHNVAVTDLVWSSPVTIGTGPDWNEYSVNVRSVQKGDRIALGMDRAGAGTVAGASQLRMYLDEVKVEVVKVNDNPVLADPVINYKRIAFSDALIKWEPVAYSDGYKVYLDGALYAETSEASLNITGLKNNSAHTVKVVAYDTTQETSTEISFTTKNVWQVKGRNQGCRMATFQWDPLEADFPPIDINGNKRLYQMEIYSDAACQNVVYTCYPYNGYASTNTAFANSSWLGKKNGTNLVYDTRITFGSLKPATTYWFRVRSLASYTITYHATGKDKAMTNPAGTSEWSEPLQFTTPARHVPAANEVIYTGFDDFCVQMDYGNGCVGTTPATTSRNTYASTVSNGANHWNGNFCTYEFAIGGHQPDTWGFAAGAKYIDGSQNPTPTQSCIQANANAGDVAGWFMSPQTRPAMGAVMLDGDRRWVATPAINSDLLKSGETTPCRMTFTYIGVSNSPESYAQKLEIRQYNPAAIYDGKTYKVVKTVTMQRPYLEGTAATNSNFTFDYSGVEETVDVDLYKGESLMIVNVTTGGVYRIVIDDIKVVTK